MSILGSLSREQALQLAANAEARLAEIGIKVKHRPTKQQLKRQMQNEYPEIDYCQYVTESVSDSDNCVHSCSICLCEFENGDSVRQMKCSKHHVFHTACIDSWAAFSNSNQGISCPLCNSLVIGGRSGSFKKSCQC